MIYPQMLLDLNGEIIVDLFAGGGGASSGIEQALGRTVDVAVNHDSAAVAMHRVNHPQTAHHQCDIFEVDPREVSQGRPIGLLWASPDCTFHSKARGAKPIRRRDRKRRALAWVVTRWAGQVRPRVIMLENVEEFADWGPLVGPPNKLVPCRRRRGRTFRTWRRSLERLGYQVDKRELRACDYGAPTIRKRLFVIARCDGKPIVWPEPTHGPGRRLAYRTAAECIDWSIPMLSIFATKEEAKAWGKANGQASPIRPLAQATQRRIARGTMRYVVNNPNPFIVGVGGRQAQSGERSLGSPLQTVTAKGDAAVVAPHITKFRGGSTGHPVDEPLHTVTANAYEKKPGGSTPLGVVAPYLVPHYAERAGQEPRVRSIEEPYPVIVPTNNGGSLAAVHLEALYSAKADECRAAGVDNPVRTVTASERHAIVAAHIQRDFGNSVGHGADEPVGVVTPGGGGKAALVASFMAQHNTGMVGHHLTNPVSTIVNKGCTQALVAANLTHQYTSNTNGGDGELEGPLRCQTTGNHAGLVYAFLQSYYGTGNRQDPRDPLLTIPTVDRFGLVTVNVAGETYILVDIAMRMLQPRELYNAQGFHRGYVIDFGEDELGRRRFFTKTEKVRMCGNSVCPPIAAALARSNVPDLIVRDAARRIA